MDKEKVKFYLENSDKDVAISALHLALSCNQADREFIKRNIEQFYNNFKKVE